MSILDHAKDAKDMALEENYRIKALLGGPSGSGKTQVLITLPREEGKKILVVDYDNRAQTLAGEEGIKILTLFDRDPNSPKAWRAGEALKKELWALVKKGEFPYSAVVEDGLSMMGTIAMNDATTLDVEHLGLGGAPGRSHWMPQIHFLRTHINSMRQLPCHYILTCHMEFMEDSKTGSLKMYPKVTKSLKPELPAWFNETYYCFRKGVKDGRVSYRWLTAGTGDMDFFKSTLNQKGLYWRDPIVVNLQSEPCGFRRLFAYRFGDLKDPRLNKKEEKKDGKKLKNWERE
ncbi:hypothetical protein LCGC14_1992460, partial [marine sediment metagenome]